MKIFIIIICLILAMLSGYLLHSTIATLKEEEFIFTRYFLNFLPSNVIKCISLSLAFFAMAAFLLIVTI